MDADAKWRADPLVWGRGPRVFEVFLEPTCPFSARAFPKAFELLERAGESEATIKLRLQSQPWHLLSGVVCRAIVAASTTAAGKEAARRALAAVFAHRDDFEFERHAGGPNMDRTPNQAIERLEALSGEKIAAAFAIPGLDRELKWHARYARQNGIHVTPTFMVDGIVRPDLGSGDDVAKWLEALGIG